MTAGLGPGSGADIQQPQLPGLSAPSRSRRLPTPREQSLDKARKRLTFVAILFSAAWLLLGGRLTYLTLRGDPQEVAAAAHDASHDTAGGSGGETAAGDNPDKTADSDYNGGAQRADITDRNGTVLATSLPTVSVCVDGRSVVNADEAERQLIAALPDLDAKRLGEDLRGSKHCAFIKRHLTPKQYYEINKLGIAGLEFRPDERRAYPAGNITAHVVGYTDIDDNGIAGAEKSMDKRLNDDPRPLALSIDLRVQTILHDAVAQAMGDYNALAAAGLVLDIRSGEILGMVSLPDFDPARPGAASDDQRFNRDTLGVYEMGSTFKIFNTALALETNTSKLTDTFDTTHLLEIGGHHIRDFEKENRDLNVAEIFTHSSNIGSAHMAQRFGGIQQRAFFERLGLANKSTVELPEVGAPLIQSADHWGEATTLTAAFGHGVAVNAVQLLGAIGSIVNDGHIVRPTILKTPALAVDEDTVTVVSPRTSAIMRGLMRLVVTHGTAKKAEVEGYMVGGKTGTADKINAAHHYMDNARLSSFVGVFPVNAPRYIVFALLDDPKGNAKTFGFATGGWVAAPAVHQVIAQIGPLLGLAPLPRDNQTLAEHETMKALGTLSVDGVSVEDGPSVASAEARKVH